jgi:type II secretory pathway pseudopilin PulG
MSHLSRRGITLIEVLVIIFILAALFALIAPALLSSRGPSRRNQCLHNMKNLGLAVQNLQTTKGGTLPLLDDGQYGWPVELLPYLDGPGPLVRDIQSGSFKAEQAPFLEVFVCPQDDDSVETPGGLSYVGNAGFGNFPVDTKTGLATEQGVHSIAQDWDGDGEVSDEERKLTQATGVLWRKDDVVPPLTIEDVGAADGAGTTLLFLENLHAGPWTSRDVREIGFVIDRGRLTFASDESLDVLRGDLGPFAIDGADVDGAFPAPSSGHDGTIQAVFVDGSASSLSEEIDPGVYIRLMTSGGSLYGEKGVTERSF